MRRIAYMLTSLGIGGAERQVVALAERMAARGHHVVLIVLKPREAHEWPTSLEVIRLDMRKSFAGPFSALARAHRFLHSFHPDLVHSHTFPANMAARTLRLLGSAPAVFSTIHNIYEGGWQRNLAYKITDRFSIHTTAVSEVVARRSIQIGAVPQTKCSIITNGIDLAEFTPIPNRRTALRLELNAADSFIWLAAGRVVPAKDYPNLLHAFAHVHSAAAHAQLWIAGEAHPGEEERIRDLTQRLRISDFVHWLGLRNDMSALLDTADAFVLSSAWEGMPLVVGEAMAMQKPVVATDVGGVRELVGDAGVLVPPNDSAALADAMLRVMHMSSDHRQSMGQAARTRIHQHFDMNAKAEEWEALYARLLRDRR
jgi:glycosyltransferase involved in cell wall biosynthesis